jgi:hypothetical protein
VCIWGSTYRSRAIEKGNWNYTIGEKAKDGCHKVVVHPSGNTIPEYLRFLPIASKLQAIHHWPAIVQKGLSQRKCHFE